ncbi:MAG: family 16 glycosylhydrolase, partial [Ghiorsea sp.]|nr:family 16 glycosylhydrolase [Ghiorsea sp.]
AYAAGEYSSQTLVPFGSLTFTAQPAKANGVVTGLFLYTGVSDGQPHDEIDIEFLGNNTTQVQLNYYVNGVGGHEVVLPLGFDASLAMHRYTIAWRDTGIDWYVDDVLLHSVTNTGQALPSHNMRIFSNIWATVGVDTWAGAFVYANAPIYAYVNRIDYASWASKAVVNNASPLSNSVATDTAAGGGCIAPSMPVFLWLMLLGLVFLLGRRVKA